VFCNTCYIRPTEPIEETRHDDRQNDSYDNLRSYIAKTGLIKILHQNVNGLLSKIDMIREMFYNLNNNIHVLGVTESKLNSTILDAEVRIHELVVIVVLVGCVIICLRPFIFVISFRQLLSVGLE
jgi:hypothetical protein